MQYVVDFILELDRLKGVERRTKVIALGRHENSAEHSWHIAMLALSLVPYADGPIDVERVVRMLLVHDVGEIDTGDTIVYADEGLADRKAAELEAVRRIFGMLPPGEAEAFLALWHEFEEAETPEARFAHAADRAMPVLMNLANGGQSWVENGISYERVIRKVGPPIEAGCPALWRYLSERLEAARALGYFAD